MDGKLNDCCQATHALTRVRGANTNLSKNYYQTHNNTDMLDAILFSKKVSVFKWGNGKYVGNCSASNPLVMKLYTSQIMSVWNTGRGFK